MDRRPHRGFPHRPPWPRPYLEGGDAFDKDNNPGASVKTHANFGAYMSLFSSAVPTYLYATLLSDNM